MRTLHHRIVVSVIILNTTWVASADTVAVVVNNSLYAAASAGINSYTADLGTMGWSPVVYQYNPSTGSPTDLRNYLHSQWQSPAGLAGAVFVGDLPTAHYDYYDSGEGTHDIFACDLFYLDLDGTWTDSDTDGNYDQHTAGSGDVTPEIWMGRMPLSPLGDEVALVNSYLDRVHQYKDGQLHYSERGLSYIDDELTCIRTSRKLTVAITRLS